MTHTALHYAHKMPCTTHVSMHSAPLRKDTGVYWFRTDTMSFVSDHKTVTAASELSGTFRSQYRARYRVLIHRLGGHAFTHGCYIGMLRIRPRTSAIPIPASSPSQAGTTTARTSATARAAPPPAAAAANTAAGRTGLG